MAETDPATPSDAPTPDGLTPDAVASAPADVDAAFAAADDPNATQASIDELLKSASFEDPSGVEGAGVAPEVNDFKLPNFSQVMADAQVSSIDLLRDVELNVKIELGRSHMLVEDVLKLNEGSVVELDKLAGDPVDVFVNDRLIARGEVLVLNDNFCVRVNEIVAGVKEEGL
jgi:flagellar motor switch protein FliN/FliY